MKNVFLLGESKKKEQGSVNGSISYSALKLVLSASVAPPHQASQKTTKPAKTTTVSEPENPGSDEDEDEDFGQTALATPPRMPAAQSRPSGPSRHKKKDVTIPRGMEKWHASWSICIKPHENAGWAAGMTGILEHMFSYESVDDLVRLANELYRTKDTIAVNRAAKTLADVRKIKSPVRIVAQRFKALWSAIESSTMSQCREISAYYDLGLSLQELEAQLDQVDKVPHDQLEGLAREYLDTRGGRARDTAVTRMTFLARHLLDVLGYGASSGHSEEDIKEKTRLLKAQKMTAKNMCLFVTVFGEGSLLLMRKSVWQSTLDQVSDKTIKPLLEKLVDREPELQKVVGLAGRIVKYTKSGVLEEVPKTIIRAQELDPGARRKLSLVELLGHAKEKTTALSMFSGHESDDHEHGD